jgi:hypothetical protein
MRYSIKLPTFGGRKKKDWLLFITKLVSYVAQKGVVALLRWTNEIPPDDFVENKTSESHYSRRRLKMRTTRLQICFWEVLWILIPKKLGLPSTW